MYNPANNTTYVVDASVNDTNQNFTSTIKYLSNDGTALGTYVDSFGNTSIFAWHENGTPTGKFITLGTVLTNDSLASANWSALADLLTIGSDGTLYGLGATTDGTPALFALKPQKAGDSNLDGTLNIDDYLAIDHGYLTSATGWSNGDFDHNGVIDYKDYAILDAAFQAQGGGLADGQIALHTVEFGAAYTDAFGALSVSAVPEPASLILLGLGAAGLMTRRRRSR